MEKNKQKVVCFGEILWDNLPGGKKPGGAPMNVAYHLNQLGIESTLISRVGYDADGFELLKVLEERSISLEYCQLDSKYKTSKVEVVINDNHEVSYDIVFPVAWDFIEPDQRHISLLQDANALVFGSLVTRNKTSKDTLEQLLESPVYKVFDINLREPYIDKETITRLLHKTDLLKLNLHELEIIAGWYSSSSKRDEDKVAILHNEYNIKEVIVTRGSSGASYFSPDIHYHYPAYKVEVNDTVGSGDSFLAAFLYKKLSGESLEETLDFASAMGAFITTQTGACPHYSRSDLNRFQFNNEIIKNNQLINQ
ncbi:carbohydrate kinase [Pedobacter sp. P351]|uniref:carbohydrate kinase family protein n=1 Tax=Pedobacter superstes TaxID=3133441 RepID=UPI0030AE21D1